MMKHIKYLLCGILLASAMATGAEVRTSANEVIRMASETMKNTPAVEAIFSITHGNVKSGGQITVAGSRFKLLTPELSTWFDGKTQWTYSPSALEVNISEPTPEELAQINPFEIIGSLQKNFSPRRLQSSDNTDKIELTPNEASDYLKLVITFNASTHFPIEIVFTATDHSVTTISISSLKKIKEPAPSTFRFNQKIYPGVETIDLR